MLISKNSLERKEMTDEVRDTMGLYQTLFVNETIVSDRFNKKINENFKKMREAIEMLNRLDGVSDDNLKVMNK